jgi:hypothetical protein
VPEANLTSVGQFEGCVIAARMALSNLFDMIQTNESDEKTNCAAQAVQIDPHKTKERYMLWKANVLAKGIQGLSESNSKIIIQYIQDMEQGINVASTNKKGGRSSARLNSVSTRVITLS